LLERIILASSNPGDLVADFFCGSGTAPACAARLGRRFLAVDGAFRAVHTTRRRLCALPSSAFSLERESASCFPLLEQDGFKIDVAGGLVAIRGGSSPDYWEVDPAWDGEVFKSAAQAQRPVRSSDIPQELEIKTGRRLCVRLVTVEGEMVQRELGV
jgi:tRNA/tmRNA/rRNA uracil-C5-methylase (TrmA/RlmC/RlmD family)